MDANGPWSRKVTVSLRGGTAAGQRSQEAKTKSLAEEAIQQEESRNVWMSGGQKPETTKSQKEVEKACV